MVIKKVLKGKEKSQENKRCASSHVSSRWYRAPELAMVEKKYDQASDMWSLGCLMFELLHCSVETKDEEIKNSDNFYRHILFQGDSCYPLSPLSKQTQMMFDSNDQLY